MTFNSISAKNLGEHDDDGFLVFCLFVYLFIYLFVCLFLFPKDDRIPGFNEHTNV